LKGVTQIVRPKGNNNDKGSSLIDLDMDRDMDLGEAIVHAGGGAHCNHSNVTAGTV